MDPAFPDIVGEWAKEEAQDEASPVAWANDNHGEAPELSDPLLALVARAEIEATRLW
jgi:uncharacterized protein (DUF2345 family)